MTLPRDVECRWCGARIDQGCHSRNKPWMPAKTHLSRWYDTLGGRIVSVADIEADIRDGEQRDEVFRREFFHNLHQRLDAARGTE